MKKTILIGALLASLLPLGAAQAQDRKERGAQFAERFTAADVNADGKLTREEAEAKMPGVAAKFDEIDVDKKGYVTKQDIAKSMKKMKAAKSAS